MPNEKQNIPLHPFDQQAVLEAVATGKLRVVTDNDQHELEAHLDNSSVVPTHLLALGMQFAGAYLYGFAMFKLFEGSQQTGSEMTLTLLLAIFAHIIGFLAMAKGIDTSFTADEEIEDEVATLVTEWSSELAFDEGAENGGVRHSVLTRAVSQAFTPTSLEDKLSRLAITFRVLSTMVLTYQFFTMLEASANSFELAFLIIPGLLLTIGLPTLGEEMIRKRRVRRAVEELDFQQRENNYRLKKASKKKKNTTATISEYGTLEIDGGNRNIYVEEYERMYGDDALLSAETRLRDDVKKNTDLSDEEIEAMTYEQLSAWLYSDLH